MVRDKLLRTAFRVLSCSEAGGAPDEGDVQYLRESAPELQVPAFVAQHIIAREMCRRYDTPRPQRKPVRAKAVAAAR